MHFVGGGSFLKAWSKTMDVLALSSGESELGALTKACTEGLGMKALLDDFQVQVDIKVLSDATAAIGMVRRLGLGKVRHLAVADLWVQQRVRSGDLSVAKFPGHDNGAELMTKYKGRLDTLRLLGRIGFVSLPGRPTTAPKRTTSWDVSKPVAPPREDKGTTTPIDTDSCEPTGCIGTTPITMVQDMHLRSCVFEGRSLSTEGCIPHRGSRILVWVQDLNTGETLYDYTGPVADEPDLRTLTLHDPRPHLLTTWAINSLNPTGPA